MGTCAGKVFSCDFCRRNALHSLSPRADSTPGEEDFVGKNTASLRKPRFSWKRAPRCVYVCVCVAGEGVVVGDEQGNWTNGQERTIQESMSEQGRLHGLPEQTWADVAPAGHR